MERGPRLPHLILSEKSNIKAGVGALFIPGLEILDIPIYMYMEFMSWLPAFVERHKSLSTITFNGDQYNFRWSQNPDILFPLQFRDAVESLDRTVSLNGFSISRTGSASLDTWRVTALELTLHTADGISGLRLASALAPELSSLVIRMSSDDSSRRPIPVDDLASALGCFPSLRRLNLHKIFQHLVFEGPAPWDSPPDADLNTSNCMIAHAALHWIMARVAQCTPTLELVHGADQGYDGKGHLMHPWRLEATYQVRRNFGLDFDETPHFIITDRFSQPR
ncbi:hypothetical protein B0H17DRAFT_1031020 [Mycena rosella]|uniref:Uncharacterized protein n=1 Tax=Mycena rosella TaxID=1033263 RepID=A0AAD7H0A0_MYCRO|nr:hypothetical protein B0H17DRAFT_1031020 [Mycena rosella]